MTTYIVPNSQKYLLAKNFLNDVKESNNFYFFLGNHTETGIDSTINENENSITYDVFNNMIQGKKISANDICLSIRNVPYELNKKFDMYLHDDIDIVNKDFYCVVNATSYYHVFKCLDNNNGSNSTIEPNFSDISGSNTEIYRTSDGYTWKYMYTVNSSDVAKFESSKYFPFIANNVVKSQAKTGTIDVIKVSNQGRGYDNYITGTFVSNDIRVNGNSSLYGISNTVAATVNGFYTGCLLYISAGDGAGEHRIINDYISNSNGNFIVLNENLISPTNGTQYQIYPRVKIYGSGSETVNAVARGLVNALASNSIHRVEMIDRGENYTYYTANVIANDAVSVIENAVLTPVYSPKNGHGFDQGNELYCSTVCIFSRFQNTESNTIIASNDYHQIGIIRDPLFANVQLNVTMANGSFIGSETILSIRPLNIGLGETNTSTNTIVLSTNSAQSYLSNDSILYLTDGIYHQIVNAVSLSNSTVINLSTNCSFSNTETNVYLANPVANAIVISQINSTAAMVTNASCNFESNDILIGMTSGVKAILNNISRNDVVKGFQTFIQATKYKGTDLSGTFTPDEYMNQGSNRSILHSYIANNTDITFYVTNESRNIVEGDIVGNTSLASCRVINCYSSELVFGSGDLAYLENLDEPIERAPDKKEEFTIYMEF